MLKLSFVLIMLVSFSSSLFAGSFTVMTYNVENLFNTSHDEGKRDWAYLPKSKKGKGEQAAYCKTQNSTWRKKECEELDWNEAVLDKKMKNLAEVILYKSADVVILEEVENLDVLEQFQKKYLLASGYKYASLLEGKDKRGIDVAIISKFAPVGKAVYHQVPYPNPEWQYTRGILQVDYKLEGDRSLSVFGVHFPSAANPHVKRAIAMDYLNSLAGESRSNIVIAGGDFNSISTEDSRLYRKIAYGTWYVSHLEACKMCLGTNYFSRADSWSFLDAILLSKTSKAKMDYSSVEIVNKLANQRNPDGSPKRFDLKSGTGVSDHFPVFAVFNY